jgi:hypothetical protein
MASVIYIPTTTTTVNVVDQATATVSTTTATDTQVVISNLQGPQGIAGSTGATGAGYSGVTSASTITIGTGLKTFTLVGGYAGAFITGDRVRAIHSDTPTYYLEGYANYVGGSTIIITVDAAVGSGSHNTWSFSIAGLIGSTGPTGATGATGPSGVVAVNAPITNAGTSTSANLSVSAASTSASGVVQLSDSTSTTSSVLASTPTATKAAYDLANTANTTANAATPATRTISTTAPLTGGGDLSTNRTLAVSAASTTAAGVVQLSDSTSTTSSALGATPTAVKAAYDAAVASVQPARSISTTAPIAGGGDLSANRTLSLNLGSSVTTSGSNLIVDSTIVPYLANANTFTASPQQVTVATAANVGLIVKGAASQSGNLIEAQNSGGTILARVASNGAFSSSQFITSGNAGAGTSLGGLTVYPVSAGTVGAVIRGFASQTANYLQVQNSANTILTSITSAGTINFASGNTSATATGGAIASPALVTGYITMQIAGTTVKVPYYSN